MKSSQLTPDTAGTFLRINLSLHVRSNCIISIRAQISFYGRQNCIQIGKDVVRVLGAPPYIAIRINPEMDSVLIESAEEKHKLSFKVPEDICMNKNRQMVINSTSFVVGMMTRNELDLKETYQIEGVYSEKNNAVVFNIKDATVYMAQKKIIEKNKN